MEHGLLAAADRSGAAGAGDRRASGGMPAGAPRRPAALRAGARRVRAAAGGPRFLPRDRLTASPEERGVIAGPSLGAPPVADRARSDCLSRLRERSETRSGSG